MVAFLPESGTRVRALRAIGIAATAGGLLALCSSGAAAGPLLFEYSGVVRHITFIQGGTDALGLSEGMSVSGSFVFEPTAPDQYPASDQAFFENSIRTMSFGSVTPQPSQFDNSYFSITADPLHDFVNAHLEAQYGPNPAIGATDVYDEFEFGLEDPTATAFLTDQVDLTTLNLASFNAKSFEFLRAVFLPDSFLPGGIVPRTDIIADLRFLRVTNLPELSPANVPEPSTLAFFGFGLLGLASVRAIRSARST